jgi:lysozyme
MISRRRILGGLAGVAMPAALAGCGTRRQTAAVPYYTAPAGSVPSYYVPAETAAAPQPAGPPAPTAGLDAVIDISHMVEVSDFASIRNSNILAVVHKATEGGDWTDPSYAERRPQAEAAGLLWGAYHFGTRQYSGRDQARAFLAVARPGPNTLMALDFEPNDPNPRNTMTLAQAEQFVQTIHRETGRLPLVYTHPSWANGAPYGRHRLSLPQPIAPGSRLARCDLWLADYREQPEMPYAWADRGWRLWQYVADQQVGDGAYGEPARTVAGVTHCDRNLFAGNASALYRFWKTRHGNGMA